MADPMTIAIACAAAGKAVEVAGEPARAAVAELVARFRRRFQDRPDEQAALERAADAPDSAERLAALEGVIRREMDADPAFGSEVTALWQRAESSVSAQHDGVANNFTGTAGKVVQMRDVHGGFTLN
ncbi:hypothetical protein [Actinomadura hibisca]|uniref:hypothetical protein n=1 Tax=Actinomadura hibisca TaxID=68565 RepID=UPI00082C6B69|nr:hypothetical protein [Actinomadura hibisca]